MKKLTHIITFLLQAAQLLGTVSCDLLKEGPDEAHSSDSARDVSCLLHISQSANASSASFYCTDLRAFVFDADCSDLDSWQEISLDGVAAGGTVQINSSSGEKVFVITANVPPERFTYYNTVNLQSFRSFLCPLEEEDPSRPFMAGVAYGPAGPGEPLEIVLQPLLARVRIRSLEINFSERDAYRDSTLKDIRCYLTNVNSAAPLLPGADTLSLGILNASRLDETSLRGFQHPEMLLCDSPAGGALLYCYPSRARGDGSFSDTVTRLVIEGRIGSTTYYYPIRIGGGVVERGREYCYDITLTRTGSLDPDTEIGCGAMDVFCTVEEWKDYEDEVEYY